MEIHESSWDSLPGSALEMVWSACSHAHPHSWIGLKTAPELHCFRLVCKAWLLAARQCTTSLYAAIRSPDFVWPEAPTFPALQRLQLSLQGLCLGRRSLHGLSLLISLQHLSVVTWGNLHPDALIQYVPFLTNLELLLPKSRGMEELRGLTTLHKLCSLTLASSGEKVPYHHLAQLPYLTSLKIRHPSEGLTLLSSLRELHLFPNPVRWFFPKSCSILSTLTFLDAGSMCGRCGSDILSVKVFSSLQKLILSAPVKRPSVAEVTGHLRRWDALTTLSFVSDLEVRRVKTSCNVFVQLGTLTQLTCLWFSSHMTYHSYQQLDQHLMNLSTLTRLCHLTCLFRKPTEQDPQIGYYIDCGSSLRAVMALRPQVNFDIRFVDVDARFD